MVKPTQGFTAKAENSAYPRLFTPEDDLEPGTEAYEAAKALGCLPDPVETAPAPATKAQRAAPEKK